jgi:hypothetical protein
LITVDINVCRIYPRINDATLKPELKQQFSGPNSYAVHTNQKTEREKNRVMETFNQKESSHP